MISRLVSIMFVLAIAALVAAGCGGEDKPAYCEDVADLQVSVDDVKNVELSESGALSTLQDELPQVRQRRERRRELGETGFPEPNQRAEVLRLDSLHHDRAAAPIPHGPAGRSGRAGDQQCRDGCPGPRQRHQLGLRLTGPGQGQPARADCLRRSRWG